MSDKTPATFDYREFAPHDTQDRRCVCGELTVCLALHEAVVEAARDVVGQADQDDDYCYGCHERRPCAHDALRAALDADRRDGTKWTHPRLGVLDIYRSEP